MKTQSSILTRWLPLALMLTVASAEAQDNPPLLADWRQVQSVTPSAAGLVRIEIPSTTHGGAQQNLSDLRLINPSGAETPFLLQWPQQDTVTTRAVSGFRARLEGDKTYLEMVPPPGESIRALTLESVTSTFLKAVTLEGSQDGTTWQPIGEPGIAFRQRDGSSQLRIVFPAGSWKQLRVTLDDRKSPPAAFTGATVELPQTASSTVKEDVTLTKTEELPGITRLHLILQTPQAWLGMLRLQTADPVFSRKVVVRSAGTSPEGTGSPLADGTVFRLQADELNAASLEIPVHRQALGDQLVLDIENGDSPPLKIDGVQATRYPVHLLFAAQDLGGWKLYSGNPLAIAPYYDLAALSSHLQSAQTSTATIGELQANPGYRKDGVLGQFAESGSAIDTNGWRRRKPVLITQPGVQLLELDLEATCHHDFDDLRLVQDGRQLPYLVLPERVTRTISLPATLAQDPKRPTWSRWKLELPFEDLSMQRLEIDTPSRVYERTLNILETRPNRSGSSQYYSAILGSVTVRNREEGKSVTVPLNTRAAGREIWIETDNGDNTPMEISAVRGAYQVARLKFQALPSGAPVYLYYDNPSVPAPRYDLRLVERELNLATPSTATLGPEEAVAPGKRKAEDESGAGSVFLWVALAAVAGGLLWVVVKLLPEQPGGGNASA